MKPIVLVGGGVNHYRLIAQFKEQTDADHPVVLVSQTNKIFNHHHLGAYIRGEVSLDDCYFDLWKACERSGVYFLKDSALNLNREERVLHLKNFGRLTYHQLSLECESSPTLPFVRGGDESPIFSTYPTEPFIRKMNHFIGEVKNHSPREVRVVLSGCNFENIDLALAIKSRLSPYCHHVDIVLFTHKELALSEFSKWKSKSIIQSLKKQGIRILFSKNVDSVGGHRLLFSDQTEMEFDIYIAADKLRAVDSLSKLIFSKEQKALVRNTLQDLKDDSIFIHGRSVCLEKNHQAMIDSEQQVEVIRKNLFSMYKEQPLVRYSHRTKKIHNLNIGLDKKITFLGPFQWKQRRGKKQKTELQEKIRKDKWVAVNSSVEGKAKQRLIYESQHMSRPWSGAFNNQPEESGDSDFRLLSFNGFDWWGSYSESAKQITQMAILKSLAFGVKPDHLRFHLSLPQLEESWLQHVFESSFKAIEAVADQFGVKMDGGDTFNGDRWRLSVTMGGQFEKSYSQQFKEGDHIIMTRPLGFGWLWSGRFHDRFDSAWMEQVFEGSFLKSTVEFKNFMDQCKPSSMVFVEEWGLLYHCLRSVPVDKQLVINSREVPRWQGVDEMISSPIFHPSLETNWKRIEPELAFSREEVSPIHSVLWDPLSQGSLIFGVSRDQSKATLETLKKIGFPHASVVGCVRSKKSTNKIILSDWVAE